MIELLYTIIVLIATTFGAIAGLGGGVIIKPLFDLIGYHDAMTIGFYSSVAVFTMCIVSIYKQIKGGFQFHLTNLSLISMGSIFGGLIGEFVFNFTTSSLDNHHVKVIQAGLLALTLIVILMYTLNKERIKHYTIHNKIMIIGVGLFLGSISVFLGIGGGPLNVAILMILFSFSMKEAAVYSIATIFFSQLSKLGSMVVMNQVTQCDLSIIPFIIISAIIGGYVGTLINQKLSNNMIQKFYIFLILVLIVISIYNMIYNLNF